MFLRQHTTDLGILGRILRWSILLVFVGYFVLPMMWLLLAPSKDTNQIYGGTPFSLGSIARLVKSWQDITTYNNGEVVLWFENSVEYAVLALLGGLAISIPAGFIIATNRFPGRKLLLWLTLISMLLPPSALVLPLFLELNLVQLVNTAWSVILPAWFFPFGVYLSYIYYASSLPPELLDAARVDGCTEVDVFRRVALPLATPLLGLLAFISFNANWNNFFLPYVMLSDDTLYNLPVGIQNMLTSTSALQPGFNPTPGAISFQHADAAMIGLIMVVPVVIVFLFAQRYVISGAFTGAIKG
ncbi:MAG: carbohydrate ABC transporter permease [Aggregatilineales bacterium]